jgi:hypothetical protein
MMIGLTWKTWVCLSAFYYRHFKNHYQVLFKILNYLQISLISFAKSFAYFINFIKLLVASN